MMALTAVTRRLYSEQTGYGCRAQTAYQSRRRRTKRWVTVAAHPRLRSCGPMRSPRTASSARAPTSSSWTCRRATTASTSCAARAATRAISTGTSRSLPATPPMLRRARECRWRASQHRPVRMMPRAEREMALTFTPRSKWLVSALLIASEDEWPRVGVEIIRSARGVGLLSCRPRSRRTDVPPPDPEPMPELSQADRDVAGVFNARGRGGLAQNRSRAQGDQPEWRVLRQPGEYEPVTICEPAA